MKVPGIYSALTLSFFLHAFVLTLSFFAAREFYQHHQIAPYIVSLEEPGDTTGHEGGGSPPAAAQNAPEQEKQEIVKPEPKPEVKPKMTVPEKKKTETVSVKEKIEALRAIKKIEKMAALRKIVDVGGRGQARSKNFSGAGQGNNRTGSGGSTAGGGDYYSLVVGKIRQQWIFPDTLDKDLETVVSIRISGDGSVTIEKVEKGSGNSLFDRSVLRAITLASPLPQPLHEMEIGVRFRP